MDAVNELRSRQTPWWAGASPPSYYSYSPATGEFLEQGLCDPSPLEPGVWLWPGHSVAAAPPAVGEGRINVWDGSVWLDCHDRRGEIVYTLGEFRAISTIGQHEDLELVVHDAQYVVPDNDEDAARIRMWVNDDIIEFEDDPNLVARQVLAQWEARGETIRPVDDATETADERAARETAEREAAEQAAIDEEAARVVEGRNIEEQP